MGVTESRLRPNHSPGTSSMACPLATTCWRRFRHWARAAAAPDHDRRGGFRATSYVLDVATGPAGVALELVHRTDARLTGIDRAPAMLGGRCT